MSRLQDLMFGYSGIPKKELMEELKGRNDLSSDMKNLVLLYHYPRPLLDRELPKRVGDKVEDLTKLSILIIEASRTAQYGRFIRHLFHSFIECDDIFPVSEEAQEMTCPICGRPLVIHGQLGLIGIGSSESRVLLCQQCLRGLKNSFDLLNTIEPGFLSSYKTRGF